MNYIDCSYCGKVIEPSYAAEVYEKPGKFYHHACVTIMQRSERIMVGLGLETAEETYERLRREDP